jgi:hypothetical protein
VLVNKQALVIECSNLRRTNKGNRERERKQIMVVEQGKKQREIWWQWDLVLVAIGSSGSTLKKSKGERGGKRRLS